MLETSFFFGAMYVYYGLAVATFIIGKVLLNLSILNSFILIITISLILTPISIRLSRIIWINIFADYNASVINELKQSFGGFFEDDLLNEINQVGVYKEIPEGFKLKDIGGYIKAMPLLVSGAVKTIREDNNGDELLLYFLEKGDTCTMTLTCCLGQTKSEIRAVAETDTKLIIIPVQKKEEWSLKYNSWRKFVFESYQNRFNEMLTTIDSIAFYKMDERLLKHLIEKVRISKDGIIHNTHQEIA